MGFDEDAEPQPEAEEPIEVEDVRFWIALAVQMIEDGTHAQELRLQDLMALLGIQTESYRLALKLFIMHCRQGDTASLVHPDPSKPPLQSGDVLRELRSSPL